MKTVSASSYIKLTFTFLISTPLHGSFPPLSWGLTLLSLFLCRHVKSLESLQCFLTNLFEWSLAMSTPASITVQVSCQSILCFADKYVEFVAGCGEE